MSNINTLVLESIGTFQPFIINSETKEGAEKLATMHIRPRGEWEYIPQQPSTLFDADGSRRYT